MRRWFSVTTVALIVAVLATPAAHAGPTPPPVKPCTNRELPPPPVSTSENPKPGGPAPAPLPVPDPPVGGDRMGECRLVLPDGAPRAPKKITAAAWIITDPDTGAVLAAKDPHGRHRPASLLKVLLALVVIDELDLDQMVTATKRDAKQECTCIGIQAGGHYRVRDLLSALLVRSGNDVAHALGTALGGIDVALDKMNSLAARLGALDTRAATTSGLDGPGMTSSAYDLNLIFQHALAKPEFVTAIGTEQLRFRTHRKKPPITLFNDNRLLREYRGFIGGKTGFTDDARHTYLGAAQRGGRHIAVTLVRAEQRPIPVFRQAARLLDYGFRLAAVDTSPVGELIDPLAEEDPAAGVAPPVAQPPAKDPTDPGTRGLREIAVLIIIIAVLTGMIFLQRRYPRR